MGKTDLLTAAERQVFLDTIGVYSKRAFAEMYFSKWRDDFPTEHLEAFSRLVGPNGKVLDAGCGPGHHTNYLHGLGHAAVGIDLSSELLRLGQANFRGPTFLQSNMLQTPFIEGIFSGIWACASVMHLPRPLLGPQLIEFHRVLKGAGVIALTMTLEKESHVDAYGRFFQFYPRGYLLEQMTETGFRLEAVDERQRERTTEQEGRIAEWTTIVARKGIRP